MTSETDHCGRTICGPITLGDTHRQPPAQLDLFKGGPDVVTVFPLHRRIATVRKMAAGIASRDYKGGQRYWSNHVHQERARLARLGMKPEQIDAEIKRYAIEVSRVIHLQEQYGSAPDGAA